MGRIQKMDIQGMKSSQKINRLLKDIKLLEQKVSHTYVIVKSKQSDIAALNKTKQNLDKKVQ